MLLFVYAEYISDKINSDVLFDQIGCFAVLHVLEIISGETGFYEVYHVYLV